MIHGRPRAARGWGAVRALRRLAGILVVLAAAFLGGTGLAATWGSTAESDDYRVTTRLIPRSQVEIPTSIGTAIFDTHAWGPGGEVAVSALSLPPVERAAGSPFIDIPAEVEEIKGLAESAATRSLQKFAAGAVAGGILGMLTWLGLRGADASGLGSRLRGAAGAGLVAGVVAVAGWGVGVYVTFDDQYGRQLEADGLLAVGLSTGELLQELNARDQAYAGYVQSLSTYISRLREDASPAEATDVAVRVLLMSDLHGRNVYAQLRSVVATQDIDVVVDAGDLVQWGTGVELTARPDLVNGIEALDVPYVWVKGNHDGPATVDRMRDIPNVIVLEGGPVEVAGLRVLGTGDPRLYQDGGPVESENRDEVEEIERAAAAALVERLGGGPIQPPVDLAVMHHPSGARELGELSGAPVWISGHTHQPTLDVDDRRLDVTVGTTGAAGIRTFNRQDETGDVAATPQSFDILDFNQACLPVGLTRFTYPDVLSAPGTARVTYETVRLEGRSDESARSCG